MAKDKKPAKVTAKAPKTEPVITQEINSAEDKAALKVQQRAKSLKFNIIAWALIVMIIMASVPINLIAERLDIKFDVTPDKYYTISKATENILNKLEEDVVIYFLADMKAVESNSTEMLVAKLLKQYAENSHVTLVSFDPEIEPEKAISLDPEGTLNLSKGDIVVKGEKLVKRVSYMNIGYQDDSGSHVFTIENYLSGALQYIINGEIPAIYFLTGHEELKIDQDLTTFTKTLKANSYKVSELNLKTSDAVPEDAKILLCVGPKSDLSKGEAEKINDYLDRGGNVSFLLQPNSSPEDYVYIERILKRYAISFKYDRVHETNSSNHLSDDEYTMLCELSVELDSGLTDYFVQAGASLYVPNSRSVVLLNSTREDLITETLFSTNTETTSSVSNPFGGSNEDAMPDSGSFRLALTAVDEARANSKVTLFGSCDFLSDDAFINRSSEMETINLLYFSTISWMYNSNVDLMIPSRTQTFDYIDIESEARGNKIITILIIAPVMVALAGTVVWLRRRNK